DEKDKKILQLLQKDGRISLSKMGEEIGLSHVSVRRRLKKLEDEVLEISPSLNFGDLGYRLTLVFVEAEDEDVRQELIREYHECPRIIFLTKITGEYNLLAIMFAENQNVQESELGQCAIRTHPGIRRSKVITAEYPLKPEYIPYTPPKNNRETAPCGPNCSECQRYIEGKCLGCPATKHYKG
ncbi:MAG: Lrp/AsnC family transcriptional regulator, partial [Thermoproteota archaeon]